MFVEMKEPAGGGSAGTSAPAWTSRPGIAAGGGDRADGRWTWRRSFPSGRRRLLAGAITVLVLGAVGWTWLGRGSGGGEHYRLARVSRGPIVRVVSASGTLKPESIVSVGAQTVGQLSEVDAGFNSQVKAGDVLAKLDPSVAAARVDMATADLAVARGQVDSARAQAERASREVDNARATLQSTHADVEHADLSLGDADRDLKRKRDLMQTGDAARVDSDKAKTAYGQAGAGLASARARETAANAALAAAQAQATVAQTEERNAVATVLAREAALKEAQLDLEHTVIRAPTDGVIVEANATLGQTVAGVSQAVPLFTLARDLRKLELHASIDEADIGQVASGQSAKFTFDAYPGRTFGGVVSEIRKMPQVVQTVVSYDVVIAVPNDEEKLLPGMTADVRIVAGERDDVLKVPNAAFRFHPRNARADADTPGDSTTETVWRVGARGEPSPVPVRPGLSDGMDTEIAGGALEPGDEVIVGMTRAGNGDTGPAKPLKF